jgi:N4-(beta-N-acetylglucosaminyl)-L-asparaginase
MSVRVIASHNGLEGARLAYELLAAGADPLEACVVGATVVEDNPDDLTVGYGGLPNEEGVVELDAAVMHGPTHRYGAVAAVRNVRHVTRLARLVMQQTDHNLLVGEGAQRFARAQGFPEENLLTDKARRHWLHWNRTRGPHEDWLPPVADEVDADVASWFQRTTGTVHFAARSAAGDLSCATSTSGLAFKLVGRVGDSPIIGAGLYADNDLGTCGATGRGEASLDHLASFAVVELLRGGLSPLEAGLEVLRRVERKAAPRLRDAQGRPNFDLQLYVLAKDGRYAGVALRGPRKFAVADEAGARLEACVALFERG